MSDRKGDQADETGPDTERHPPAEKVRLRPLAEVLPPGEEGSRAFEQLMHAVLEAWGQRAGFRYLAGDGGGVAAGGVAGLEEPTTFVFAGAAPSGGGAWARTIPLVFGQSEASDSRRIRVQDIKRVICLHPGVPGWEATAVEHIARHVPVETWGPEQLEPLLRACPALLARYYPEEAESAIAAYDGLPYAELVTAVRRAAVTAHAPLRMLGIPTDVLDDQACRTSVSLAEVFVPLRLLAREDIRREHSAADLLREGASCVLLGDPGSGKSTLLLYLALVHAGGAALGDLAPPQRLPLYLPLRELVKARVQRPGLTIVDYLAERARERDQIQRAHPALFEAALRLGEAIVFFDGLDEVGSESARRRVADDVKAFRAMYPRSPVWVTSRKYGYTGKIALPEDSFRHFLLAGLDSSEVNQLVERWYAARESVPGERERLTRQLQQGITRAPSVRRLAQNPLLLTLMALLHRTQKKLPRDRGELYEHCVQMLLRTWHEAKREEDDPLAPDLPGLRLRTATQKDYLAHLAAHIQEKNAAARDDEARGLIERKEALEVLAKRHLETATRTRPDLSLGEARDEMDDFLTYIADRTGLLIDRGGGVLSFIHLSFQEYLAAWVFTCTGDSAPEFFEARIGRVAWEEVLLLRLYIILNTISFGAKAFDEVVARLLREMEKQDRVAVWLTLARALRDNLEFRRPDRRAILERAVSEWLKQLLQQPGFAGEWFDVLLEMTLFTDNVGADLRALLVEGVAHRPRVEAIACLHLATRLFGFPAEAIGALESRRDLASMRADLCAFFDAPAALPLLAEARPEEWTTLLEAADGADAYRRIASWVETEATTLPPAALEGATAWLWRQTLSDLASRTAFASKNTGRPEAGNLFTTGEILRLRGQMHSLEAPCAVLRAPAKSPGPAPARTTPIAWRGPVAMPTSTGAFEAALERWVTDGLRRWLTAFPAMTPLEEAGVATVARTFVRDFVRNFVRDFARAFGRNFVRDFARAFVRDFARDFARAFVRDSGRDFVRAFVRDFVRAFGSSFGRNFARDFARAFVRDFGRNFVRAFGRDFGRNLVRDFVRDFVRAFGRDFVRDFGIDPEASEEVQLARWDRAMADDENVDRALGDARFWDLAFLFGSMEISIEPGSLPPAPQLTIENPFTSALGLVDHWTSFATILFCGMSRDLLIQFPTEKIPIDAFDAWLDRHPIDAFSAALAWGHQAELYREQAISLTGERGALVLAHAAYAACRAGFLGTSEAWETLLAERDTTDPRIEAAHLLFRIATFQDTDGAVVAWKKLLQDPPPALRPLLEATRIPLPPPAAPKPLAPSSVEAALMPAWFEARPFPWHDPRANELRALLVDIHPDIAAIRMVGRIAGVLLDTWVSSNGPGPAWESLLDCAAHQDKTRVVLERLLTDKGVAGFHPRLRDLMNAGPLPGSAPTLVPFQPASTLTGGHLTASSPGINTSRIQTPASNPVPAPAPTPAPAPAPQDELLFSWLHLSDIHAGQGNAARGWDQDLVLDALARDADKRFHEQKIPAPRAIFVTGDIAFSGKPTQYESASRWLEKVAQAVGLGKEHIHLVPGNHDIDRAADRVRATSRLVRAIREGDDDLDDILHDPSERAVLAGRMTAFSDFAREFAKGSASPTTLFWSTANDTGAIPLKLLGLNTAILAMDQEDHGKLRLGKEQTALLRDTDEAHLTLVLTHHPFSGDWLRDEKDARAWLEQRADIHLCGHIHEPEVEQRRTAGGTGIVTVTAGATHGDRLPEGAPESHGYNWAAVYRTPENKAVLRVWPRVWSTRRMDFRLDVSQVPDGHLFAEYPLPRLRLSPSPLHTAARERHGKIRV